jgi:hypothetical protein
MVIRERAQGDEAWIADLLSAEGIPIRDELDLCCDL